MAEALHRKYRPQVFDDIVGQGHIERTLKNAIASGKVSHAYLFCGPRGTGKTTTARLLAKALLCEHGPTDNPDGTCEECKQIAEGVHPDVYELDAASRTGVESVREEIINRVSFAPTRGKHKVYIIDEVHMLSMQAFNALLKTLEEPPSHVVFLLCTTDPQKVPETIQSRCQRFDFHRLSTEEIVARLGSVCVSEGVEFEPDALDLIAHRAEGGMRNALTSLEQLIAFGEGTVTMAGAEDLLGSLDVTDMAEIMQAIGTRDIAACFNWTASYVESGADLAQFARDMASRVRNMYVLSLAGVDAAVDIPDVERRQITGELELFGPDRCANMLVELGELINALRTSTNPRLSFEIALTRMVRPDSRLSLESLAERVEALEAGKSAVAMYVPPAVASVGTGAEGAPAAAPMSAPAPVAPAPVSAPVSVATPAAVSAPAPAPTSAVAPAPTSAVAPAPAVSPLPEEAARAVPASPALASPASSAVPASTAGDNGVAALVGNPAALQRVWRSVATAIKNEKVQYGVLFVNAKMQANAQGNGVVLEFSPDSEWAFQMAQKPEVTELLASSLRTHAGMDIPFELVQARRQDPATPSAPAPSAPAAFAPAPTTSALEQAPAVLGSSSPSTPDGAAGRAASQEALDAISSPTPKDIYALDPATGAPREQTASLIAGASSPFGSSSPAASKQAAAPAAAPSAVEAPVTSPSPEPVSADVDAISGATDRSLDGIDPNTGQRLAATDGEGNGSEIGDLSHMFSDALGVNIVFEEVEGESADSLPYDNKE